MSVVRFLIEIPYDPDKRLDFDLFERAVYETRRDMESVGVQVESIDVVIARSALKRVWKEFASYFKDKFGILYNIPEDPPGKIHEMQVIEEFVSVARIFLPHCNTAINLMVHPYFACCPNLMAVVNWHNI